MVAVQGGRAEGGERRSLPWSPCREGGEGRRCFALTRVHQYCAMVAAVTEQEAESSAAKFVMMLLFTMKQKQICFNSIQFKITLIL